ncbi:MAG: tape measure protein [Burkholderiaceae bacterium]
MGIEASFRITAQLEQAIKALGSLKTEIDGVQAAAKAGTKPAFTEVGTGAATASTKMKGARKDADDLNAAAGKTGGAKPFGALNDGASALGDKVAGLRTVVTQFFAAVAGIQLGNNTLAMIDAYGGLTARLRVTTGSQLLFNEAMASARGLSAQYQAGLANTAKLIDRVYASIAPLGGTLRNATTATEALLASLKISGATAEETSSAILQFSQALGKGVLNGDEFNSINEAAPGLLRALGDALGKSTADLKKMGEQGTLTSDVIIKAATIALPKLRQQAADIGPTIGGSFTAVNNALTEFVGKGAQANGTARIIAGGMKLLADNIGLVVNALGLLAGAALLSGVTRLVTALPALAAGVSGVGLAIRGALAFITGPVGLIVALGSLALAWVGVDVAQRASTDRTLERVKAERDRVSEIVRGLDAKNEADKASGVGTATQGRQASLERNLALLRQLDGELSKLQAKADAAGGDVDIRADGPLKAKLEENKGRRKLDEEYARDREIIESQSAKKIAALRREGRNADADNLAVDAQQSLGRLKKTHDDAIKALSKDETNTRLAQYIEEYDRIAALVADGTTRELKTLQGSYEQQLLSTRSYFSQRGALEDEAKRESIAKIEAEITARQAVVDRNSKVRTSSANEAAALAEANKRELEAINKLEIERVKAQRDLKDSARDRAVEEGKVTEQLLRQRQDTDLQIKAAQGLLTLADERLRLENQYADARKREFTETGDTAQTDQLIATQLRLAELARLKAQFSDLNQALALQEQELALQVDQGALTAEQAETRKFEARAESIPQLEEILRLMREIAVTPADQNVVKSLTLDVKKLKDATLDFQKAAKDSAVSSLATALTDIQTGAKSGKEALLDMVRSFGRAMLELLNRKLADALINQFIEASSKLNSGSGGGSFWTMLLQAAVNYFGGSSGGTSFNGSAGTGTGAIYAHTGAVVGRSGGWSGRVPAAVFDFAPRYHTEGIVGLKPRERGIIALDGEEVLTEENPRHIKNYKNSVGGVSISVTVNGAEGNERDQRGSAEALTEHIRAVVTEWAAHQSRQGGMFAGR